MVPAAAIAPVGLWINSFSAKALRSAASANRPSNANSFDHARQLAIVRSIPSSTISGVTIRSGSPSVAVMTSRWREDADVVNAPCSTWPLGVPPPVPVSCAGPCSMPRTPSMMPSTRMIGPATVCSTHGDAAPRRVPGATSHRISTAPRTPSMRRASSDHGSRPATPVTRASVTFTRPDAVVNVVSSTFVPTT